MINLLFSWNNQETYGFLMLFRGFRSEFIHLISLKIRSGIWRLSRLHYPAVANFKVYFSRFSDEIVHSSTIKKISQNNHGRNFSQLLTFSWSSEPFLRNWSVYILWKQEKTTGFLIFLGSIEIHLLHELG